MAAGWRDWAVDRFGLKPIYDNFLDRRVPKTPWYYGDGSTLLFLFGVLVVTGMALALTYSPTPETAYDSVEAITSQWLGWFVRGLHYWSAGLLVVMLFFHLFRLILVAGYKFPREGTWLLGTLMFFGFLTMSFLGYLLRWDERAIHALHVALHMFYRVPWVGEWLVYFIQGGPDVGARTLTRFYSLHVIILPLILLGLAGFHLYLVVVRGITSPAEKERPIHTAEEQKEVYHRQAESEQGGEKFYPDAAFQSGAMALTVFGIAVALTLTLGPSPLYPEANLVEDSLPAEEWWFWWYSALIALLPSAIAPWFVIVFPVVVFLAMVLLPFVDRGPYRGMRKRPFAVAFVVVCVIGLLVLTDLRRRSPWTGWPDRTPPPVPSGVSLPERAEAGRVLFARYGCNSCHAVAGHGPEVGSDLARLSRRYSRAEIAHYMRRPPDGVPMPSYEGRMPPDEFERVVEFVHVAQTFPWRE